MNPLLQPLDYPEFPELLRELRKRLREGKILVPDYRDKDWGDFPDQGLNQCAKDPITAQRATSSSMNMASILLT